jgi:hypothetical protein
VESVGANGVLKISEDNYGGDFHWVYVYPGSTGYYPYGFIHFTPAASANGATLHTTDTNRLYRVAGGAPLLVSACPDNCTAAIQTTQAAVDRMAAVPANGTALRAVENGSIYRVVGGAPLWINACVDNACAAFVQVTQSTIDQLDHLRSRPADGSFVRAADTGSIYRIAGGAPMWLNGCVDTACRDFVNVNQWTVNTLNHLNPVPVNRTAVRAAETGAIYRVAGGAPMWLSSCIDDVCQNFVTVNQHTIDSLDHLTGRPADRTDLRSTNSGAIYRIVSGQPMWLAACVDTACQDFVNVTGSTLATKYGVS